MASNIIGKSYLHLKSDKCRVHAFMPEVSSYSNLKQNFPETSVAKWLIRSCVKKRELLPFDCWRKDLNNNSRKYSSPTSSMLRFSPGSRKKPSAIHKWTSFFLSNSYSGGNIEQYARLRFRCTERWSLLSFNGLRTSRFSFGKCIRRFRTDSHSSACSLRPKRAPTVLNAKGKPPGSSTISLPITPSSGYEFKSWSPKANFVNVGEKF